MAVRKRIRKTWNRLMTLYVVIFVVVLFAALLSTLFSTGRYLQAHDRELHADSQATRAVAMRSELTQLESLMRTLVRNTEVQMYFADRYTSYADEVERYRTYIRPLVTSLLSSRTYGLSVQFIRVGERAEIIDNNFEGLLPRLSSGGNYLANNYRIFSVVRAERYPELANVSADGEWLCMGRDRADGCLSLLATLYDEDTGEGYGWVRLTCLQSKLFGSAEQGDVVLFGDEALYAPRPLTEGEQDALRVSPPDEALLVTSVQPPFRLLTFDTPSSYSQLAERQLIRYMLITAGMLLAALLAASMVMRGYTRRIQSVADAMARFQTGSFDVRLREDAQWGDIAVVERAFNAMGDHIQRLVRDQYQSKLAEKDAQLRLLQTSINPHMLYNSLSAINRLSRRNNPDGVEQMVQALTTFYRISLNKGNPLITVRREIEHLKAYMAIQSIRFGDSFTIAYDWDEDILGGETVNVVLQPFVENVFEHAFDGRGALLHIRVAGRREGERIVFTVSDDGAGFDVRRLSAMQSSPTRGYAIHNVDERIRLTFGQQYGVTLDSEPGRGTTATIVIPYRLAKEDAVC